MEQNRPLQRVPDEELLDRLSQLTHESRCTEADRVAHIAEVDERKLYARKGCSSMFSYCIEVLHLSEPEAHLRIVAARASLQHPMLLTFLAEGKLHLSGIALLAPHLTIENREAVLARAFHRSKRQIELLVAELSPRPDVPAVMRKLPSPRIRSVPPETRPMTELLRPDEVAATPPPPRPVVEPLAPARYKVQFTASATLHSKLERLRALMRAQVPDGDLAAIIEQAVTEKLERLEARRFGATRKPRKTLTGSDTSASSRHIPAAVRRFVVQRDGMQCRYIDEQGRRCSERHDLQFHHRHPVGFGGDHRPDGICLLCGPHNRLIAELDYGPNAIPARGRGAVPVSSA
jgi:hypothetical protein